MKGLRAVGWVAVLVLIAGASASAYRWATENPLLVSVPTQPGHPCGEEAERRWSGGPSSEPRRVTADERLRKQSPSTNRYSTSAPRSPSGFSAAPVSDDQPRRASTERVRAYAARVDIEAPGSPLRRIGVLEGGLQSSLFPDSMPSAGVGRRERCQDCAHPERVGPVVIWGTHDVSPQVLDLLDALGSGPWEADLRFSGQVVLRGRSP